MALTLQRGINPATQYDLLIIGAGITGVAIAYQAAASGLSVALLEKGDIGAATSAATGKLIHGGLRYLKNFEIGLVRESLAERRVLSNIAPGLVHPIPMVLPSPGPVEYAGLTAYDLLSFDRNRVNDPAHRIPSHKTLKREALEQLGVTGMNRAIVYHDVMMPYPDRLTLAFLRSAVAHGADFLTYAPVTKLTTNGKRVTGVQYHDTITGTDDTIQARMVVNATGPYAHDLLAGNPLTDGLLGLPPATRSEGIYLVTRKLADIMVLYVSPKGHFSFAPWRGKTLIGPTETPYAGEVEDWKVTDQAVDDLVAHINATASPEPQLTRKDVLAVYGGLRPLAESADDSYNASRGSELVDHAKDGVEGLVTATGGKYTTSRAFARQVMRQLMPRLRGKGVALTPTDKAPLHGCNIGRVDAAIDSFSQRYKQVSPETAKHLVCYYGAEADDVMALAAEDPALAEQLDDDGEILAQVIYALRHEGAQTLSDLLQRRTGLGTLGRPSDAVLDKITEAAAREARWSDNRSADELSKAVQMMTVFDGPN